MNSQFQLEDAIERLPSITSVSEAVNLAHDYAIRFGFNRIRFYEYINSELRFVSREAHGHDPDWAEKFRNGTVVRWFKEYPTEKRESFWCLHEKAPIVVLLCNHRKSGDLQLEERFKLKCLSLTLNDYKSDPLPYDYRDICVHFPLEAGKRFVGKFCCDAMSSSISSEMERQISSFWRLCKLIAPTLEILLARELNPEPLGVVPTGFLSVLPEEMHPKAESVRLRKIRAKVIKDMNRLKNSDELLNYCTSDLPRLFFGCKFASFFTLSEDSFGSKLLVLRRTSFEKLKEREDLDHYDLNQSDGLTVWVARHRTPLRCANKADLEARKASKDQGMSDKDTPVWADGITDSEIHNGFLAVPVISEAEELLGVLRFTQKINSDAIFSESDQRLLVRLTKEQIAPRLERLAQSQRFNYILERLPKMAYLAVQDSVSTRRLAEALTEIIEECIPPGKGQKRYLVNKLDRDGRGFYVDHLGGTLPFSSTSDELILLAGTMTEMALRPAQREALYIQDFRRAGITEAVLTRAPNARCALECRISFGNKDYAVLVILSDRFDLTRRHARLLELICMYAGGIRARREMHSFELTQMGLGHDFQTQLYVTQKRLEALMLRSNVEQEIRNQIEEAAKMNRFAMGLMQIYLSPGSLHPSRIESHLVEPISILSLIHEVVAPVEAAVDTGKRGIITVQVGADVNSWIWQEPVAAILFNLLKNALGACSPENGVVEIGATERLGWLELIIANNGGGLSEDLKRSLSFDPMNLFLGSVRHFSEHSKGYGLYLASRLAMCYRLCDGRSGQIEYACRKSLRCQNQFIVTIPLLPKS